MRRKLFTLAAGASAPGASMSFRYLVPLSLALAIGSISCAPSGAGSRSDADELDESDTVRVQAAALERLFLGETTLPTQTRPYVGEADDDRQNGRAGRQSARTYRLRFPREESEAARAAVVRQLRARSFRVLDVSGLHEHGRQTYYMATVKCLATDFEVLPERATVEGAVSSPTYP